MKRWLMMALLLVAGCAGQPVPPQNPSAVKTVGVISLVGDRFTLSHAGWTPFGNSTSQGIIQGWGVDQRIATDVAASLGQRFAVTSISFAPGQFGTGIDLHGGRAYVSMSDGPEQPLHQALSIQPGQLDGILLVTPAGARTSSGMLVGGLGVLESRPFFAERVDVHALYRITLVSASDDTVIASGYAPELPDCQRLAGPCSAVSPSLWSADFTRLTPVQLQTLQGLVEKLIDTSVPATLHSVGLTP